MIHHLKIYPEHFSAVCTGVKRAELRKSDRDFKVGDTLHLMETPKGSCSPTGEYINAVVTHIADVGEWLPGYVMLSIEREPGYAAPQSPQPAEVDEWRMMCGEWRDETVSIHDASGLIVSGISPNAAGIIIEAHNTCRAAQLQGAEPVSQPYKLPDDTRRLDWLDAQNKRLNDYYGTAYGWKFDANFQRNAMMLNDSNYPVMTVRQAIDEAMAAAPQQEVK